jgi:hypothetical protein
MTAGEMQEKTEEDVERGSTVGTGRTSEVASEVSYSMSSLAPSEVESAASDSSLSEYGRVGAGGSLAIQERQRRKVRRAAWGVEHGARQLSAPHGRCSRRGSSWRCRMARSPGTTSR